MKTIVSQVETGVFIFINMKTNKIHKLENMNGNSNIDMNSNKVIITFFKEIRKNSNLFMTHEKSHFKILPKFTCFCECCKKLDEFRSSVCFTIKLTKIQIFYMNFTAYDRWILQIWNLDTLKRNTFRGRRTRKCY